MIKLTGASSFTWSTSEQVWPFEKDINGNTLYCKQLYFASLPNNGTVTVAHNISDLNPENAFSVFGSWYTPGQIYPLPFAHPNGSNSIQLWATKTYVGLYSIANFTGYPGKVRLIYTK